MYFDRRISGLETMLGKCPVCSGKPRIVVVDETEDFGPAEVSEPEPENCAYCGGEREALVIRIVSEQAPYPT